MEKKLNMEDSSKVDVYKLNSHPDWMTQEFIEEALQESERDSSLKVMLCS